MAAQGRVKKMCWAAVRLIYLQFPLPGNPEDIIPKGKDEDPNVTQLILLPQKNKWEG